MTNPNEASGHAVSEEQLLEAATAPVQEAKIGKPSETAMEQKEAEEEAAKAGESQATREVEGHEGHHESHHEDGGHKHGFIKIGKKLLPMHHKSAEDDGKDPRLMNVSVKK